MSRSVRVARKGRGITLILGGIAVVLGTGASLTAALSIAVAATGNLAVAATHRPSALDRWPATRASVVAAPMSVATRTDALDAIELERNRFDDAFDDTQSAALGRDDLRAKLADASLPTAPVVLREAELVEAPRQISPDQPVQMASLTPAIASVQTTAPDEVETLDATAEAQPAEPDHVEAAVEPAPAITAPVRIIPIPKPRPADFARMAQPAAARERIAARPVALAYATPELEVEPKREGPGDFFGRLLDQESGAALPRRGSGIAVYDIASATVRMPNGERLEAHSGLAHRQDNPAYVREKNRGPTPPNVYDLRMREALFHGAAAIRLLPRDQKKVFNRDGLLAHPYMYVGGGDRSQSNGCVVFKDYGRFLKAFRAGEVTKLVVVPNIGELPTYMAGL